MKDFPFWRGAIYTSKTVMALKSVGEDLSQFQNQSDFLGGDPKLNAAQLTTLRTMYSDKMKPAHGPPKKDGVQLNQIPEIKEKYNTVDGKIGSSPIDAWGRLVGSKNFGLNPKEVRDGLHMALPKRMVCN